MRIVQCIPTADAARANRNWIGQEHGVKRKYGRIWMFGVIMLGAGLLGSLVALAKANLFG